jgi:WD domain, G-beta repeat
MSFLSNPPPTLGALNNDMTLASPPEDSISSLAWSPAENYLAVGSWDNRVRIYDITKSRTGIGAAAIDFEGPVLSCHWSGVWSALPQYFQTLMENLNRTGKKWLVLAPIKALECLIFAQTERQLNRLQPTTPQSDLFDSSKLRIRMLRWLLPEAGIERSNIGI